jgi:hypothetical protein
MCFKEEPAQMNKKKYKKIYFVWERKSAPFYGASKCTGMEVFKSFTNFFNNFV